MFLLSRTVRTLVGVTLMNSLSRNICRIRVLLLIAKVCGRCPWVPIGAVGPGDPWRRWQRSDCGWFIVR